MGDRRIFVLISANSEWRAVKKILNPSRLTSTLFGEVFKKKVDHWQVTFVQGGWGKISASASTQYVINHFHPELLVNLGTCGGFEGYIDRGTILLVTKTVVYDILEQMSDPEIAISYYSTDLDLSWFNSPNPQSNDLLPLVSGPLASADRDLIAQDIPGLVEKYGVVAADWESAAIAWVANQNKVRCLILRGVTDLVGPSGGEAYGDIELFHSRTMEIMQVLLEQFPRWLSQISWQNKTGM